MLPIKKTTGDEPFFWQVGENNARRGVIYGPGGIGKTELCCRLPGPVAFIDLDDSLPSLRHELKRLDIPAPRIVKVKDWQNLLDVLRSLNKWGDTKSIVIDTATRAEEMCIEHCLANVPTPGDNSLRPTNKANGLEDYGWGKDIRIVYEQFIPLLTALEAHRVLNRNVILIAHDCKPEEVNPMGANYVRWEPRLRTSKKGDNSIRLRVKEWADFVGFFGYFIAPKIEKEKKTAEATKKAIGSSRVIYFQDQPQYMAKGRGCPPQISIDRDTNPWPQILSTDQTS